MPTPDNYSTQINSPYGCNMAFRMETIEGLHFDERLALYGWLEDLDFGLRAGKRGRMISTDLVWGVHLGVQGARSSGVRFGYSQVVNPWYLMIKGLITRVDACRRISRGLAGNAIKLVASQKSHVDRRESVKKLTMGLGGGGGGGSLMLVSGGGGVGGVASVDAARASETDIADR